MGGSLFIKNEGSTGELEVVHVDEGGQRADLPLLTARDYLGKQNAWTRP